MSQDMNELCSVCRKRFGDHLVGGATHNCPLGSGTPPAYWGTSFQGSKTFSRGDQMDERCVLCSERWGQHNGKGSCSINGTWHPTQLFKASGIFAAKGIKVSFGTRAIAAVVSGGMKCCKCQNFNDYAQPNQGDGTFKCYGCRS